MRVNFSQKRVSRARTFLLIFFGLLFIQAESAAQTSAQCINLSDSCISGRVAGHDTSRPAFFSVVSVNDDAVLVTGLIAADGSFFATGLNSSQDYYVRFHQTGFRLARDPGTEELVSANLLNKVSVGGVVEFVAEPVPGLNNDAFVYSWRGDPTVSGSEYSSFVPKPIGVEILGPVTQISDEQSALRLLNEYNIVLENPGPDSPAEHMHWTSEQANRLYRLISALPFPKYDVRGGATNLPLPATHVLLTSELLPDDLMKEGLSYIGGRVKISAPAFANAEPNLARIEGKRGIFYSNRLFRVVLRMVSDNGNNYSLLLRILQERYGLTAPSDVNNPLHHLPRPPATCPRIQDDCSPGEWRLFKADELIDQIAILEEYPAPLLNLSLPDKSNGYRYLLRRRDGVFHPIYKPSMAVAWLQDSYAEYMEHGFSGTSRQQRYHLIVHEKAHFIWGYLLDDFNRMDWLRLSGWWKSPMAAGRVPLIDGQCALWRTDPMAWNPPGTSAQDIMFDGTLGHDDDLTDAAEGLLELDWGSCTTTTFVTRYSASNPNEDFADSFAMFMINPDLLRSRAPQKYEFLRDRLMQGSIYLSIIRQDLSFEVFNLYPDYVYPGKIKAIDVAVKGAPEDNKVANITMAIHALDCGAASGGDCFEGAEYAQLLLQSRLLPDGSRQTIPVRLRPRGSRVGDVLEGTAYFDKLMAAGWWQVSQISLVDQSGNERQLRQASGDFGWKMYINNPLEDVEAPKYVEKSTLLRLLAPGDSGISPGVSGDNRELILSWRLTEQNLPNSNGPCQADLAYEEGPGSGIVTSFSMVGSYRGLSQPQADGATMECVARWIVTPYFPTGFYSVAVHYSDDRASNRRETRLSPRGRIEGSERAPEIFIESTRSDIDAPILNIDECQTLDLSEPCLRIIARPTNPSNPNGETIVDLYYWAWENAPSTNQSGLGRVDFWLRNPLGVQQSYIATCNEGNSAYGVPGKCPTETWVIRMLPDSTTYSGVNFNCPSGGGSLCDASTPVQYHARVILPIGSPPGTWGLAEMMVTDKQRNRRRYDFSEIFRFDPSESSAIIAPVTNLGPVVAITGGNRIIADTNNSPGETVTLNATASDSDGTIASTQWLVSGQVVATGTTANLSLSDGTTMVTFRATDNTGATTNTASTVTVVSASSERSDWLGSFNSVVPDEAYGLRVNSVGLVLTQRSRLHSCVRIFENGMAQQIGGAHEIDVTFNILSIDQGVVRLIASRPFAQLSQGLVNRTDCSGIFESTTGVYSDFIKLGNQLFETKFKLTDDIRLDFILTSAEEVTLKK